jgi:hypothetical protein
MSNNTEGDIDEGGLNSWKTNGYDEYKADMKEIYEKEVSQETESKVKEPEPEPESEPKTSVPEEYFKLETGQILYSITSSIDTKLFNNVNDNYVGEKIGNYLEGNGQAKIKLVSCEKPMYKTLKEAREAFGVPSLGETNQDWCNDEEASREGYDEYKADMKEIYESKEKEK